MDYWFFFIFLLIGALFDGSSKSENNSTAFRDSKKNDGTNKTSLQDLADTNKISNFKTKKPKSSLFGNSNRTPPFNALPTIDDEIPSWPQDNACSDIINAFNQYGVSSIWHMTHKDNVGEILRSGVLSNKTAYEIKNPTDISDHGVQRWRESKDPIYGRKLHEYAPTYIKIRNPMLYVRRDIENELCLIEISLAVLLDHNFIFTDGNAASRNTNFYNTTNDLDKLPWDVLNASYWNDFPDGKRKRCSEILIYPMIPPKHIIKLHCCSSETAQYLTQFHVPIEVSKELFF